ncbi:MAG: Type 1 glutamine amidotransferase-like domain-containing protein [Pirellulaceae bacterium]|nr:Type 1 glutamine amidotransferase-like domain-containing protein [Pirellulaceae bacterium]
MIRFRAWAALVGLIAGSTLFVSFAAAAENLLGLPTPRDPARPGAVVLHGGGRIDQEVFDRFVELAGGANASIVLIPSAGYRPTDYGEAELRATLARRFGSWVGLARAGRIKSFQFLYTDDPADADDPAFVRPLETATGVWFSGGDQTRLNYRFVGNFPEQTRFQQALRGIVERGGVVGGTSAGMAAMPEIMTVSHDRSDFDSPCTAIAAHGLGLLKNAVVEQHFDARGGRLERFTGLLRDAAQLDALAGRKNAGAHIIGLAAEERTAIVVQGDRVQALGSASAHIFLKSLAGRTIIWHELRSGDSARLTLEVTAGAAIRLEEPVLAQR